MVETKNNIDKILNNTYACTIRIKGIEKIVLKKIGCEDGHHGRNKRSK